MKYINIIPSPLISCAIGLFFLLSSHLLFANDSTAVMAAGGLVLHQSDDIVMEREELFISEEKIRVSYVFHNTSSKAITTRVAFPLPVFPEEPESDISLQADASKPMNFSVTINDKPHSFDTEIKRNAGEVKMTHHWMQTFPANQRLTVEHEYNAGTGGEAYSFDMNTEQRKMYCIEPDIVAWHKRYNQPSKQTIVMGSRVHYILKTGAHWKGAIGHFRLTIEKKNANDLLSLCGSGFKKTGKHTFVFEQDNFVPKNDLFVLFLERISLK